MREPFDPQWEQVLRAVREADENSGASKDLELRLRAAFRSQHATRHSARRWAAGAIAASLVAVGVWQLTSQRPPAPTLEKTVTALPPAPVQTDSVSIPVQPRLAKSRPVVRKPGKRPKVARAVMQANPDFVELPFAPALTPWDSGQVIRVRLPRSSMRTVGLPVNEERLGERVQADVLMGDDGIARAVRFLPGKF